MSSRRPVGKTRDAGWQIGVSRTFPVALEDAWEFLLSTRGLDLWLGQDILVPLAKGQRYRTRSGTTGEIRSLRPFDRVRLTWQPHDRADDATVQLALTRAAGGCTVRFHAERLYDGAERAAMRDHWRDIIARLSLVMGG